MPSRRSRLALCAAAALAGAAHTHAEVRTFQNGTVMADGLLYWGTQDASIREASPTSHSGTGSPVAVDSLESGGQVQGLLKFSNIFGPLSNQIPLGSTIQSVSLTFNTSSGRTSANTTSLYRMNSSWHEYSTWSTSGASPGVTADATTPVPAANGPFALSTPGLLSTVQAWANGTANEGWRLAANGSDDWAFSSSESGTLANRPKLSITYTPPAQPARPAAPKNVIVFVGDGMGLEHIKAAKLKTFGNTTSKFAFEFASHGLMMHDNATQGLTDSAASATAMATGTKVDNGVISQVSAGNGTVLPTALEILRDRGKRTGLVTTTNVTDATPAAFGAHVANRTSDADEIAKDYVRELDGSRPNVLFGRPGTMDDPENNIPGREDYTVISTSAQLTALSSSVPYVSGQFNSPPSLSLMATRALDIVSQGTDGFFLMVENEDIDSFSHDNELSNGQEDPAAIAGVIAGVQSLNQAVVDTIAWLTANGELDNTLILVVADHETGGLTIDSGVDANGNPNVTWTTTGHTQTPVGIWAMGPNADLINGETIDNTDVFRLISTAAPEPSLLSLAALGGFALLARRKRH